jgi:hypothetical protein
MSRLFLEIPENARAFSKNSGKHPGIFRKFRIMPGISERYGYAALFGSSGECRETPWTFLEIPGNARAFPVISWNCQGVFRKFREMPVHFPKMPGNAGAFSGISRKR